MRWGRLTPYVELALLAEYGLRLPVVDDPGDFKSFVDNHLVLLGVRF